jgi:hypothetical protein
MKRLAPTLTTFALLLSPILLGAASLHRPAVAALFTSTSFRRIERLEQLPEPVRNNLLSHFGKPDAGLKSVIANPNEPFNAGDAIDIRYPMRRLLFAGTSESLSFAYYVHGGIALHYHLVIYQRGVAEPIFSGTLLATRGGRYREPPATIDELKQWLNAGDVTPDAGENHDW